MGARMVHPTSTPPLVELREVSARYGWDGPWVLRHVAAHVTRGTLVKVRGPNGSGKSTLLRLLAGATVPSRGRRLAARSVTVGYSPERLAPPPPLSAAEYLRHHSRLRGLDGTDGERAVARLADRLALTRLLPERLDALSRGSLQKVVLVQALLATPDLLVLDEPLNGLDLDAQRALVQILGERRAAGSAVVLSDHGALDAPPIADVTWQMVEGAVHPHTRAPSNGVLERHGDDTHTRLLVTRDESDRLLVALVADGWHIETVTIALGQDAVHVEARRPTAG
ncbi:MAG: ATP-binding cassette domain-containing protein [Solirubrobacteraceae bacterium]